MKKKTGPDGLISKERYLELAQVHQPHCISVYMPAFRAGQEVDSGKGRIILKNLLKEIRKKLYLLELKPREIDKISKPFEDLLEDIHFWRNQSDGLAIFLHDAQFEYYTLPVRFEEHVYVADHFLLTPTLPFFTDNGLFYLLSLSLKEVNFYECTRHSITEIFVEDLVPEKLEEAVGYDYEQKSLQFRTGQDARSAAMFHGQGSGKDDKSPEVERFFNVVDKGLMEVLHDERAPLVLACVEEYYPMYRKVSDYDYIFDEYVSGNPEQEDPVMLHEKAWDLVKEHFQERRREKTRSLQDFSATGRSSYDIRDIVPASVDGRVDTLFVKEGTDEYGVYHPEERKVETDEASHDHPVSLYNMAVVNTLLQGGDAFLVPHGEMPLDNTSINAFMRY